MPTRTGGAAGYASLVHPTCHAVCCHPRPFGQVQPRGLENVSSSCFMNAPLQCLLRLPAFAPKRMPFQAGYSALANAMACGCAQQPVGMQDFVNAISGGWAPMADPMEKDRFNGDSHQVLALLRDVACSSTPCDCPRSFAAPLLLCRVPHGCWGWCARAADPQKRCTERDCGCRRRARGRQSRRASCGGAGRHGVSATNAAARRRAEQRVAVRVQVSLGH